MREMIREAKPIPKPSRAPEAVTEREESRKPALTRGRVIIYLGKPTVIHRWDHILR